jgi:hypothetical protein
LAQSCPAARSLEPAIVYPAIVEKSSGTALTTVISLTFRESCFRTQRFIAPNGIIIMQIDS